MSEVPLLLEYPAWELLAKFGMGSHKPGSGSAAAFYGMMASQLIHTVIAITQEEKYKGRYQDRLPELLAIDKEITDRIYSSLVELFQKDAVLFDKVIMLRRKRDIEEDPDLKDELARQALEALMPATDVLIEIGDYCADLADYAARVFDNGFQGAKGDSGMALNGALAGLGGCLSIIDLNLSLFGNNEWTVNVREQLERLRTDHQKLTQEAKNRTDHFTVASRQKSFKRATGQFNSGLSEGVALTDRTIESIATQAVGVLWEFRDLIWDKDPPEREHEAMKPEIFVRKILGYQFGYDDLGFYDENGVAFQVAGQINKKEKVIVVSKDLSVEVQRFTVAHELGHALLHPDMGVLHRDRPLDGLRSGVRDLKELQADKFAAYFLMPEKIVRSVFQQLFSMEKFFIDANTAFHFGAGRESEFKRLHPNLRSLSRFVASFKGRTFRPLHEIFDVSIQAMAIRLEELGLVEY